MTRGSNTYYYHYDGLGSVTELTDSTGTLIGNYTYDPYGLSSVTSSAISNPFQFTGRRLDEEIGSYYYRARQYDPMIGRFLQRDPTGYEDGMNIFAYVKNNPINYFDPFGRDTYYINNWINLDDTTSPVWGPISHSFVAVTDTDPKTGKQIVKETYSWVATNGGEWEPIDKEKNIKGAQKAIDTNVGVKWYGGEDLDPYVTALFIERQNEKGGFFGAKGVCKMQANKLINDAKKKRKSEEAMMP
ncbi:MAG: RHS repeat-associated core domain-containing protein [Candidatus Omnitrophica bacterium]|nr:RHS repeat-associated core domain-containing protein [Candidatus Omnitrophota bacterium]